jgi:hypothetical protein
MNLIDFSQICYGNFLVNIMWLGKEKNSLDEQQNLYIFSNSKKPEKILPA